MNERRYDDDEVQEILERATEVRASRGQLPPTSHDGMTLADLREIGVEVGIPSARIEDAVRELELKGSATPPATLLGAPRSVSRLVPLKGPMDDEQWDRLVADLRRTFGAVGKVTSHGTLRTWRNGNLQAHVDPYGEGWRLRMETFEGDAGTWAILGSAFGLIGFLMLVLAFLGELGMKEAIVGAMIAAGGMGQLGYLRFSLPQWADRRALQLEAVEDRLNHLLNP